MKNLALTLALGAFATIGATSTAEARTHVSAQIFIGGYQSCGTPIYYERYVTRYDPYGYPVWGQRRCAAPARHYRPYPPHYYHPPVVVRPPCPPPVVVRPCPPPVYGRPVYGRPVYGGGYGGGYHGGYHGGYRSGGGVYVHGSFGR